MPGPRIKICGLTRVEDACAAAEAGVDAVGLVFYAGSPRAVDAAQAARIRAALPPYLTVVGLFVNATSAAVHEILEAVSLDVLQFHGDEAADWCESFRRPWMKALRVRDDMDIAAAAQPYKAADALLLDAFQDGVYGGTGQSFDWSLITSSLPRPIVLAGGLKPENVGSAIKMVQPAAVDVSGGVESAPGIKDAGRIREFVAAVRAA